MRKKAEVIAQEIVGRYAWTSNVFHDGKIVGLQVAIAAEITEAIRKERQVSDILRAAVFDIALALIGVTRGRLKFKGRKVQAAIAKAEAALAAGSGIDRVPTQVSERLHGY